MPPATPLQLDWRRFHPLTLVVRGWLLMVALVYLLANQLQDANLRQALAEWSASGVFNTTALLALGLAAGILALVLAGSYLGWRVRRFRIDATTVQLAEGLIFRRRRQAPLERLQSVDAVRPLVARILGLAELKLVFAGSGEASINLAYLKAAEAAWLRAELLRIIQARQLSDPEPVNVTSQPVAHGDAVLAALDTLPGEQLPGYPLAVVPLKRTIAALVWSWVTVFVIISLGFVAVAFVRLLSGGGFGALWAALPVVISFASYYWNGIMKHGGLKVAADERGLHLQRGLTEQTAHSLPYDRIQAVAISQPLPWRPFRWWRVHLNLASLQAGQQGMNVALTVGTATEAAAIVTAIGQAITPAAPAGQAAMAVGELLATGLSTFRQLPGCIGEPAAARLFDPLSWRLAGVVALPQWLAIRRGRINRSLILVPHARTQAVTIRQGPWERRRGIASLAVHSTPGPVIPVIDHLTAADAAQLAADQLGRARSQRG